METLQPFFFHASGKNPPLEIQPSRASKCSSMSETSSMGSPPSPLAISSRTLAAAARSRSKHSSGSISDRVVVLLGPAAKCRQSNRPAQPSLNVVYLGMRLSNGDNLHATRNRASSSSASFPTTHSRLSALPKLAHFKLRDLALFRQQCPS